MTFLGHSLHVKLKYIKMGQKRAKGVLIIWKSTVHTIVSCKNESGTQWDFFCRPMRSSDVAENDRKVHMNRNFIVQNIREQIITTNFTIQV